MSVAMPTDITVVMRDEPGEIARLGELIGADGVHVRGLAAFTGDGHGFVHLLLDDADVPKAKAALSREKIKLADTRDVLVVDLKERGVIDVMLALAEANVNVDLAYTANGDEPRDRHRRRVQRARRAQLALCSPLRASQARFGRSSWRSRAAESGRPSGAGGVDGFAPGPPRARRLRMMSDLAFAGLSRQAELVRSGEVSSLELVELCLERIERFDGELNAFAAVYADEALAEARAPRPGPLSGVPVAVKDEMDIAGRVTSHGAGVWREPAAADSEVVARLRAAGAIVIGKTKMCELGLWPFTESITWGVTRNPWDTDRTPGGSSGGSAAAVAAGLVPAAVAADGAGSIRIPAACCGLFGLKPHTGRVPRAPHEASGGHWVCFGALTRSVADSELMLDVMAGGLRRAQRRPLRIAYSETFPPLTAGRLSDETRSAMRDTAALLRELGHVVEEHDIDLRPRTCR